MDWSQIAAAVPQLGQGLDEILSEHTRIIEMYEQLISQLESAKQASSSSVPAS